LKKEQKKIDRANEPKKANARNNWLSVNFNFFYNTSLNVPEFGGSVKYERMLNSNTSLGTNAYIGVDGGFNTFVLGIDAVFRYYPWGKAFFLGAALGYGLTVYDYEYDEIGSYYDYLTGNEKERIYHSHSTAFANGIVVTPEIGWKIDFGIAGGFYLLTGVSSGLFFAANHEGDFGLLTVFPQAFLGMGLAF